MMREIFFAALVALTILVIGLVLTFVFTQDREQPMRKNEMGSK